MGKCFFHTETINVFGFKLASYLDMVRIDFDRDL